MMIVHIDRHLLARLAMQHRKRGLHIHEIAILGARAQQRSDHAFLVVLAAEVVVEDGEEGDGVDGERAWGTAGGGRVYCIDMSGRKNEGLLREGRRCVSWSLEV